MDANLKLKLFKCMIVCKEVEYLGDTLTPNELKPNPRLVQAVVEFPAPKSVKEVRQFLGLCSYYRRFIKHFAAITHPLSVLTQKNQLFCWIEDCHEAFKTLKWRLTSTPVLAYPILESPFVLETDASICGMGTVLSQAGKDGLSHPVAYVICQPLPD